MVGFVITQDCACIPGLSRDLFVFDSCYSRSFLRERLNCLSPVLHHGEKSTTCWACLVWWKSKSMRIRNLILLGILGGTDLQPWHWTEWNGAFFISVNSSEVPLACICALSRIHSLGLKLDLPLEMGYLVNSPLLNRYPLNEDILQVEKKELSRGEGLHVIIA